MSISISIQRSILQICALKRENKVYLMDNLWLENIWKKDDLIWVV